MPTAARLDGAADRGGSDRLTVLLDCTFMDAEKHTMWERFLRLDSSFTDAEKHTMWERVFWAIPPVLVAWMFTFAPLALLLALLSG